MTKMMMTTMTRTNSNHPVLIDCDTGIDDALALVYLAGLVAAGEVQLRAVTTTAGNVDVTQTALNSTHILRLCGLPDVPVVAGVPTPLAVPLVTTPETHGPHGLGYVIPPETSTDTIAVTPGERPDTVPVGVPATDTGWDDLWCANRDATLIITGPATNLATYLRTHPAHQRICLMGGAYLYPGNTTPTAEWNTWVDPHAAAEVFHATIPITVCPLGVRSQSVTESMLLSPDLLDAACDILAAAHHPLADVLPDLLRFYFEFHQAMGEGYQAQIHDLITTMVALGTVDYATTTVAVDVETTSPLLRGTTVADFKGHWSAETTGQPGRKPVVKLVTGVDPQQAWAEFFRSLQLLASTLPML